MSDQYGSDYLTISDEDGNEYELEILSTVELNGNTYHAVISAEDVPAEAADLQISILKAVEECGEPILYAVDDPQELEAVNQLIMDMLYDEQ